MNTTLAAEVVLKPDVLGRVKTPKARREELLDEFERSGVSGRKLAELIGVKYETFAVGHGQYHCRFGKFLTNPDKTFS